MLCRYGDMLRSINQPRIIEGRRLLDDILSIQFAGCVILDSLSGFHFQSLAAFYLAAVCQGSIGMQGKIPVRRNRSH